MGTSVHCHRIIACVWDHPHAYGDKLNRDISDLVIAGSSPRVWGQGKAWACETDRLRIIPTRMGTRLRKSCRFNFLGDHPHAYGDKCLLPQSDCLCSGSSPRVWGQVTLSIGTTFLAGIIPTRMGTSVAKMVFLV